jgi:transcriptional pleiotropic regulator of transition state genes
VLTGNESVGYIVVEPRSSGGRPNGEGGENRRVHQSSREGGERLLKSTGIVRRVDDLGRVVIPVELRRTYGIDERDALEIFTQGDQIILRKYEPLCVFCGSGAGAVAFQGKTVCIRCRSSLGQVEAGTQ